MIICKYQTMISKDGGAFEKSHTGEFKTSSNKEADKVIDRWNYRGAMKNVVGVKYDYSVISYKNATLSEWDDPKMPHRTENRC